MVVGMLRVDDGRSEMENGPGGAIVGICGVAAGIGGDGSSRVARWVCRYVSSAWRFTTCREGNDHRTALWTHIQYSQSCTRALH